MQIAAEHILKTKEKLNRIMAENCGRSLDEVSADSDRDNWRTADEALSYGLIDRVVTNR